MVDSRNIAYVARDAYENEEERDRLFWAFLHGAQFMHERLSDVLIIASYTDSGTPDPARLDWIRNDLDWSLCHDPRWKTHPPPAPKMAPAARPAAAKRVESAGPHERFGPGWNPDRFRFLWLLFRDELITPDMPPGVVEQMERIFIAGLSAALYDILEIYERASTTKDAEMFRLYLRDFRRSLERRMQPADKADLH